MASSSPPPTPSISSSVSWDVFLSFRGADTRKGFVGHLYAALDQRGFYTFKDDERLRGGEMISLKLLEAIEQSRSAVVIFSKDYASSSWCLDELVKIMYCKEKLGLAVYPVFYDVAPSDVRRQRESTFGEGFTKAAERNAKKADGWRKALHDAAGLSGHDVTADGLESQCIKNVVEWCSSHSCNLSVTDEDLIGMPSRVRNLKLLLERDLRDAGDVKMIGIWGMGGAGKTTVADAAFREVKKQFHGASFIADVREKSKRIDGLQLLQKKIMCDILLDKTLEVDRVSVGKEMIKERLGHKKVLIILDDVDNVEQLHALAGDRNWFGKGSRVLVTTRDRHLLEAHGVDKNDIHSANLLSKDEALRLFNRHAFNRYQSPIKEYNELSLHVVHYAAGLPLALKVLGSFLCGRGMIEWNSALERLKTNSEEKILDILQISYDGLKPIEKEIFLDIACLFKGWEKDEVIRILAFDAVIGIEVLVQKSLIFFSNDQKFQMHDLLEEMGKNIGGRSRLNRLEDVDRVLQNNYTPGTEAIEAIVERDYDHFSEHPGIDAKAFENMKKLRILYLSSKRKLVNKLEYLSDELRWLSWNSYPYESLPQSFQAPKLVRLEMKYSNIVQLWEGTKRLYKLKVLDLSFSRKLVRTPDFSGIPNLETLILCHCFSLKEVHPSIGDLQRLVSLSLRWCENLVDLPETICRLKNLKMLDLSGCPIGAGHKPVSTSGLSILSHHLSRLSCLRVLHLRGCGLSEKDIPVDIDKLSFLEELYLGSNEFSSLPSSVSQLSRLKILHLSECRLLKALPELPSSIAILMADGCRSLECMEGLPEKCEWLWKLSLRGCSSLISCDHNCHCNTKEKQSSISSGRSKSAEERVLSNAAGVNCRKHSKLAEVVKSMLLQGRALVNYRLSIYFSEGIMDLWRMWFNGQQQIKKGKEFVLQLPPNWQNETTGFAMCAAFPKGLYDMIKIGLTLGIRFRKVVDNKSVNIPLSPGPEPCDLHDQKDIWIGYISFKMLRRSCEGVNIPADLIDEATQLSLSFHDWNYDKEAEFWGARVVDNREDHMQEVDWEEEEEEASSAFCPSISSGLQRPEIDPYFAASPKLYCEKGPFGTVDDTTIICYPDWIKS